MTTTMKYQLSRNISDVRKVEDDNERSTLTFGMYDCQRRKVEAEMEPGMALRAWEKDDLAKYADVLGTRSVSLRRCLQSEDVVQYWRSLCAESAGMSFVHTEYFGSKWVDKAVHRPGGGVSEG